MATGPSAAPGSIELLLRASGGGKNPEAGQSLWSMSLHRRSGPIDANDGLIDPLLGFLGAANGSEAARWGSQVHRATYAAAWHVHEATFVGSGLQAGALIDTGGIPINCNGDTYCAAGASKGPRVIASPATGVAPDYGCPNDA